MAYNDLFGGSYRVQYRPDSKYGLLVGVTKNSAGAALGSCTVNCFTTTPRVFVGTTVSDGSGNYRCYSALYVACFLVAYKAGAPDVAGTSVNTLLGV